jgi:hypothetical protein
LRRAEETQLAQRKSGRKSGRKKARRTGGNNPAAVPARKRRGPRAAIAIAAIAAGGIAWWVVGATGSEPVFLALAANGQSALGAVRNIPYEGTGHLGPGQSARYRSDPPTSGKHDTRWTMPGFYDAPQIPAQVVHALEHGNVVVYYDRPDPETRATLESWAGLFRGQWSGLAMMPRAGLGQTVMLTAWRRSLTLKEFDAAAAAAFIDRFRGRGPEHPVR